MAQELNHGVKEKIVTETRQFLGVFGYVWVLLAVFDLHRSLVLEDPYLLQHQSLAILKALALAKILFVAEKMGLGERFKERPLIWPMLFKSALFAVLLMTFNLIEKVIEHKFFPHAGGQGDEINLTSFQMIFCAGLVMFVALIPFFGIRELGKVLGASNMYKLFFLQRMKFHPAAGMKQAGRVGPFGRQPKKPG